jgi:hypothetical protein
MVTRAHARQVLEGLAMSAEDKIAAAVRGGGAGAGAALQAALQASHGRHGHSTLSLAAIDCHSLGIYTVILRSLLSFSVKMTSVAPGYCRWPWASWRRGCPARPGGGGTPSRTRRRTWCALMGRQVCSTYGDITM